MKIGILGGGIGGLSTAIALKMAGFEVDVYERRASTTQIGAGIVCWPNASFVLDKLGVLDQVAKVSGSLNRMNRISREGEALGSLDINRLSELMGYPSFSIIRKDLMAILDYRVKQLGIKVHYDHNVSEIISDESGLAVVKFDNGLQIQPEVVIGADGRMNSVSRQFVNGDNTPIYQGFINWIGVYESETPVFNDISVSDYWGISSRFGVVPVTANKAYWAGGTACKEVGSKDPSTYKSDLNALFTDWSDTITKIIEETPLERINKVYVHDHNHINVWHKDNVLLIGDAAHAPLPTSGQGACQALEDAWHISQFLTGDCSDLQQVFTSFTELRKSKTQGIGRIGRQFASSLFNTDPQSCNQRNLDSLKMDFDAAVVGMAKGWASGLGISG